jgi:PIN domain nuclease of toxin-antitoxin system
VHFSAVSVWEAGIKSAAGKLVVPDDLVEALQADGFLELVVTARHAHEAARLPPLHRDPFDRMIVAQARAERLIMISADRKIADYGATMLW